jgi:hypothetical protein
MGTALELHNGIVRLAITTHDGALFYSAGDSIGAAFVNPADALAAAIGIQQDLAAVDWGEVGSISVRVGLDTGLVEFHEGDYLGPPVNRAARVLDQGKGGDILLTSTTADLVRHRLPEGVVLYERGAKTLAGVDDPVRIYQVGDVDAAPGRRRIWVALAAAAVLAAGLIVGAIALSGVLGESTESADATVSLSTTATVQPEVDAEAGTGAVWRAPLDGRPSEPLVSDGVVYVGTDEIGGGPTGSGRLYAIDLQTGEVLWELTGPGAIRDAPIEVDGVIYTSFASIFEGGFSGVDAEMGALLADCAPPERVVFSTAVAHEGQIYAAGAGWVFAFPAEPAAVDRCEYRARSPLINIIDSGPVAVKDRWELVSGSTRSRQIRWLSCGGPFPQRASCSRTAPTWFGSTPSSFRSGARRPSTVNSSSLLVTGKAGSTDSRPVRER